MGKVSLTWSQINSGIPMGPTGDGNLLFTLMQEGGNFMLMQEAERPRTQESPELSTQVCSRRERNPPGRCTRLLTSCAEASPGRAFLLYLRSCGQAPRLPWATRACVDEKGARCQRLLGLRGHLSRPSRGVRAATPVPRAQNKTAMVLTPAGLLWNAPGTAMCPMCPLNLAPPRGRASRSWRGA